MDSCVAPCFYTCEALRSLGMLWGILVFVIISDGHEFSGHPVSNLYIYTDTCNDSNAHNLTSSIYP